MPRPPRLHIPGAFYHVIVRGNHREALFERAADRQRLNDIVGDVLARTGARVHAFCWMTNHLHVLVQVAEQPLGRTMQRIAVRYSRYRHTFLRTTGHLFERRYKAKLVEVEEYFLTLLRYIHRNPVKARIVSEPAEYPWSSHQAYLGRIKLPWLTTDFALSLFSTDPLRARHAYSRFISEGGEDDDVSEDSHSTDSRILGSDRFIENLPFIPYTPRSPLTLDQLAERDLQGAPPPHRSTTLALARATTHADPHPVRHSSCRASHRYAHRRRSIPSPRSVRSHENARTTSTHSMSDS